MCVTSHFKGVECLRGCTDILVPDFAPFGSCSCSLRFGAFRKLKKIFVHLGFLVEFNVFVSSKFFLVNVIFFLSGGISLMMTYGGGFWTTVELLVALSGKSDPVVEPFKEDIEEWLEAVSNKVKLQLEREKIRENAKLVQGKTRKESVDYRNHVDCSLSYPPVRTRLEMLMGSNVVRLTDRKYMLKLMSRIRQDYESQQELRIEERKKKELMRTKKMILNRLIPVQEAPVELRKYPLFQLYLYCDAIIEEKRRRRMPKKARVTESLYRLLYPDEKTDEEEEEDEDEEIYMKTVYIDGSSQLVPMSPQEISDVKREQEAVKDIEDGYMLSQEEYDRLHYETEAVKELRETQTVEEMYAKAYEVVGILYSYVDEGRYKKVIQEKNAGDKDVEEGSGDTSAMIGESETKPETDIEKSEKTKTTG